ncbi:MAG TPA: SCP2 sterol-binding domain-containing protein [Burkholderiales bacterium]|nr:SCP2 sterol-binding domain-containing protein [Burkholderiales bacterium]
MRGHRITPSRSTLPERAGEAVRSFKLPRIPAALGRVGAMLPQYPPAALLCGALNLAAKGVFAPDDAARLERKVIALRVRDAGLRLTFRLTRGVYEACAAATRADATVSADARDFLLLALGNVDPDTLFFDRRLLIEGDTEIGLIVKSALDRIPVPLPEVLVRLLRSHLV